MPAPMDGCMYYSPVFLIVATGPAGVPVGTDAPVVLPRPAAPVVTLAEYGGGAGGVAVQYSIQEALDGGGQFVSQASPLAGWAGGAVRHSPVSLVQWTEVPYAKCYYVWRENPTPGLPGATRRLIYQGSGREIYSGQPTRNNPSRWWPQDFAVWDFFSLAAETTLSAHTGRVVTLPGTANPAYRGYSVMHDFRDIALLTTAGGTFDSRTLPPKRGDVEGRTYADLSPKATRNLNEELIGQKRGLAMGFSMAFRTEIGGAWEKALIDLANAEFAHADGERTDLPGLQLFACLNFNPVSTSAYDSYSPANQWVPVRLRNPEVVFRPAHNLNVTWEPVLEFEVATPLETIPYPLTFDSGLPLVT